MDNTIPELIEARIEADNRIKALEGELEPLRLAKQEINQQIIEVLKSRGELSTKTELGTASITKKAKAKIIEPDKTIAYLKESGQTQFITEAIGEEFEEVLQDMLKENQELPAGVVVQESEYLSLKKAN